MTIYLLNVQDYATLICKSLIAIELSICIMQGRIQDIPKGGLWVGKG